MAEQGRGRANAAASRDYLTGGIWPDLVGTLRAQFSAHSRGAERGEAGLAGGFGLCRLTFRSFVRSPMDNEPPRIASLSRECASTGQLIVSALLLIVLSLAAALALALSGFL